MLANATLEELQAFQNENSVYDGVTAVRLLRKGHTVAEGEPMPIDQIESTVVEIAKQIRDQGVRSGDVSIRKRIGYVADNLDQAWDAIQHVKTEMGSRL